MQMLFFQDQIDGILKSEAAENRQICFIFNVNELFYNLSLKWQV